MKKIDHLDDFLKPLKVKKSEKGITTIEILIAVVVIIVLLIAGLIGLKNRKSPSDSSLLSSQTNSTTQATSSSKATTGPYAGWNSYTTNYQKLSFNYPSNWQLSDNSNEFGNDFLRVQAPDGFSLNFQAQIPVTSSANVSALVFTQSIKFTSQTDNVDYFSYAATQNNAPTGPIDTAFLSTSPTQIIFPIAHTNDGSVWDISMNSQNSVAVSDINSNTDFKDAMLIIKSAVY